MSESKIIFVGGIHGVGKGTLCNEIARKFDLEHLTASEVLKWNEISDLKNKKVKDISSTQDRLLNNLRKIISSGQSYLLDGHFTLLNSSGNPQKIEDETFIEINPISIILLTCEASTILSRLSSRDNSKYNLRIIQKMQKMEIEHANHISKKLNIPLFEIKDNNNQIIYEYLNSL